MPTNPPFRRRPAFTLTEILVVLAILGILVSILFAVFSRVRERGRQTSCLNNERQILLALSQYIQDADGFFPVRSTTRSLSPVLIYPWYENLVPFTKSRRVFQCPTDIGDTTTKSWLSESFHTSYAGAYDLMGYGFPESVSLARVTRPATTVFLSDSGSQTDPAATPVVTPNSRLKPGCWLIWDSNSMNAQSESSEGICGPSLRHNGLSNVGFVDGHTKAMRVEQWYYNGVRLDND